jgi:hypothetical protein
MADKVLKQILEICNQHASANKGSYEESLDALGAVMIHIFRKVHKNDPKQDGGNFTPYAEDILKFLRSLEQAAFANEQKDVSTQTSSPARLHRQRQ